MPEPEVHDRKRIQDFAIGHIIGKKIVVIKQRLKREIMFDDVGVVVCRIPSNTAKLLQSVAIILPVSGNIGSNPFMSVV
jgi:hypothetical protein